MRGEANLDSTQGPDISDAVFILQWLFTGGRAPKCIDAADVNDDGGTDISDPIALLGYPFQGTAAPKAPFPDAGFDPTPDSFPCDLLE